MKTLQFCQLPPGAGIIRPDYERLEHVEMDSPAIKVMTDLRKVKAVTAPPHATLGNVHEHMIHNGVRMVLVTDAEHRLIGLLTATDLLGPRPLQAARELDIPHDQLRVEHIMTPAPRVQVLNYLDVTHADVQEIVGTLRDAERHHALVLEKDDNGRPLIRGIFSLTQIERQLGVHLEPTRAAHNLSEITRELSS